MKQYAPEKLVAISRYRRFVPSLPAELQSDIFARIRELIGEEKRYTDFRRTKTLCQGGDCCDFDFVRHRTDAGDGWERTKSI